jgi:hypothetical protein
MKLLTCFLFFLMATAEAQASFFQLFQQFSETSTSSSPLTSSRCELTCSKTDSHLIDGEPKYNTIEMGGPAGQGRANFLRKSDQLTGVPYLDCEKRKRFCLSFFDGLVYRQGKLLAKTPFYYAKKKSPTDYIYVMDADGNFFAATRKEVLHHSSFLAAGPVASAGIIRISDGEILMLSNESGHYHPNAELLRQAITELNKQGVHGFEINEKDWSW